MVKSKYVSLKSIGFIGPNNYCIMEMLIENFAHQLFYVYDLDYTFESFTSEAVLNGGNVVSALHCHKKLKQIKNKFYIFSFS